MMQVITRKEAIAQGLSKFFTGNPCKHGHISEHWTAGGCVECQLSKRRDKNAKRLSADWEKYKQDNQKSFDFPIMSRQEAKDAGLNFYFTGHACINGHTTKRNTNSRQCYGCRDAKRAKSIENGMYQMYSKRSFERHREKRKAASKAWKMRNANLVKAYTKKWSQENKEYLRSYRKANSAKRLFEAHLRRKRVIEATPEWVDKNLILSKYKEREKISNLTGVVYHVDHYYPLQGDIICGLNVPWNLQVITAEENLAKNNKMPEEFYGENHTPPTWGIAA